MIMILGSASRGIRFGALATALIALADLLRPLERSISVVGKFLNVVHQAIKIPLRVHFHVAPQCEPRQMLVVLRVPKYR